MQDRHFASPTQNHSFATPGKRPVQVVAAVIPVVWSCMGASKLPWVLFSPMQTLSDDTAMAPVDAVSSLQLRFRQGAGGGGSPPR